MIESHVGGRQRAFDSGHPATRKEGTLSPWTKPLIKEMVIALPARDNRYKRQAEPGKGGERSASPWGKPLPKENVSAPPAGNSHEGYEEPGREKKIKEIKDRLSCLGAAREKAKNGSERAENLGKEHSGRVQFEMSYAQFLRLMPRERGQDENTVFLKEAPHPVVEAIDMLFDLMTWLIGLFLSPILQEGDEKEVKKDPKKGEDDWYGGSYETLLRRQFQEEKEDDSGTVKIYRYGPRPHETRQGLTTAGPIHA